MEYTPAAVPHSRNKKPLSYFQTLITALAELLRQGHPYRAIAQRLNEVGIVTHSGAMWTEELVRQFLHRFRNGEKHLPQSYLAALRLLHLELIDEADIATLQRGRWYH